MADIRPSVSNPALGRRLLDSIDGLLPDERSLCAARFKGDLRCVTISEIS